MPKIWIYHKVNYVQHGESLRQQINLHMSEICVMSIWNSRNDMQSKSILVGLGSRSSCSGPMNIL